MGVRGPVPKRTSQRLGHLTKAEKAESTVVKAVGAVEVPPADDSWHQIAKDWYASLENSGQKSQLEPSDWAAARFVAHELTRMLADAPNAAMMGRIWSAMNDLLTTEGARRRVKLEIDRKPVQAVASVTQIGDYADL